MSQLDELIEDKLPIKYILGIEKEFETYPDAFDIVYAYILKIKKNLNIKAKEKLHKKKGFF